MKAIAFLSAAGHLQYFTLFPFSRSVTLAVQIGVKLCHKMCVKWNKCDSVFQYDNVIGELYGSVECFILQMHSSISY